MDITQQLYFSSLAETGSVSETAARFGVSQPAISSWLKNLEKQMGTPLVIRSRKGMTLTPAGRIYLEGARQMIAIRNETYQAIFELSKDDKELIRVAGTPNGGADIFSYLMMYVRSNNLPVKLQFVESYNKQALRLAAEGRVDIAIASTPQLQPERYDYIHTRDTELVLMAPACYEFSYDASRLKKNDPLPVITLEKVKNLPFIMPSSDMSYYDSLKKRLEEAGAEPEIIFQSSNVRVIYNMICQGNGVGILPKRYFSPLDNVCVFSLEPAMISHGILAWQKGRALTPNIQTVMEIMSRRFSAHAQSQREV